jgi:hypothetical protein
MHACREAEVASRSHQAVDATYLAVGPDELHADDSGEEASTFDLFVGSLRVITVRGHKAKLR